MAQLVECWTLEQSVASLSLMEDTACCSCILEQKSKTCLKQPLNKKTEIGFQDRLSLNACQKYICDLH